MRQGLGFIADPEGHRYTSARRVITATMSPPRASLDDHMPGVLDQQDTSSCVGHSLVVSEYATCSAHGMPIPLQSPAWTYKVGLAVDRDDPRVPLQDEGSMPNQVMRGVEQWGTLPIDEYPLDKRTLTKEPTVFELERASRARLDGWRQVTTYGSELVEDLRRALSSGFAVSFAIDVDQAFFDYDGRGEIGPMTGANEGGHMIMCFAYETLASGATVFTGRNSWGTGWGSTGNFRFSEAFVTQRMTAILVPGLTMRHG